MLLISDISSGFPSVSQHSRKPLVIGFAFTVTPEKVTKVNERIMLNEMSDKVKFCYGSKNTVSYLILFHTFNLVSSY
jgi:hypothetical protein